MLDYHGNTYIFNPSISVADVETVDECGPLLDEIGISSIMIEISSSLDTWSLGSNLQGYFGMNGIFSCKRKFTTTEK